MAPLFASQQALMKSLSKDDSYMRVVRNKLNSIAQQLLGNTLWLKWKAELDIISNLLYFWLTSFQGSQTLGEEYTGMIQVDSTGRKLPSKYQHVLLAFLEYISPYLTEKGFYHLHHHINDLHAGTDVKSLYKLLKIAQHFIPIIKHVHMLMFFLYGDYLSISKRLVGIKHLLLRPYVSDEIEPSTFRWLFILGGIQLITMLLNIHKELVIDDAQSDQNTVSIASSTSMDIWSTALTKCLLCLNRLHCASTTRCGHVFCWKCIIEWTTAKPECPVCRESCYPSRIVCLYHYEFH